MMNYQDLQQSSVLRSGLRPLQQFGKWWLNELAAILPGPVHRLLSSRKQRLVIDVIEERLVISLSTSVSGHESCELDKALAVAQQSVRAQSFLARLHHENLHSEVRLREHQTLIVNLQLPQATEENLRNVLAFEMDRYTPFNAQQVYFDYRINSHDPVKKTIDVTLFAVPQKLLDKLLRELASLDLYPDVVTMYETNRDHADPRAVADINLLPAELRPQETSIRKYFNRILIALIVLLTIANLVLPIVKQRHTISTLQTAVDHASQSAEATDTVRKKRDKLRKTLQSLVAEKQHRPSSLQLLDELSRILPDTTWLNRFELTGNTVSIHGQSQAASRLIPLLDASDMFDSVSFRSPVTENLRTHREVFKISATVRPLVETLK